MLQGTDADSASRRHSAVQRVNSACMLTLGSADNICSTLDRVKHACLARRAFDLRARYPISYVRRQGVSDHGVINR